MRGNGFVELSAATVGLVNEAAGDLNALNVLDDHTRFHALSRNVLALRQLDGTIRGHRASFTVLLRPHLEQLRRSVEGYLSRMASARHNVRAHNDRTTHLLEWLERRDPGRT